MATDLAFETAYQAALIWAAVEASLFHALDSAALAPRHVAAVLRNFEADMRRWRWDSDDLSHPVRWTIRQEREVQDILWLILRSYFDDVIDEETLPKFGHASYRIDFGIPSLGVIVEVKYAFERSDFKKIEKEIIQDLVPYLSPSDRYRSVIVFIYDASASVQEHDMTRQSLLNRHPGTKKPLRPADIYEMLDLAATRGRLTKRNIKYAKGRGERAGGTNDIRKEHCLFSKFDQNPPRSRIYNANARQQGDGGPNQTRTGGILMANQNYYSRQLRDVSVSGTSVFNSAAGLYFYDAGSLGFSNVSIQNSCLASGSQPLFVGTLPPGVAPFSSFCGTPPPAPAPMSCALVPKL